MHGNIGKTVSSNYSKGWQTKLTAQQIQIAEAVCGNLGETFGYETTTNNLPKSLSFTLNNWLNAVLRMKVFLIYLVKSYFYLPNVAVAAKKAKMEWC